VKSPFSQSALFGFIKSPCEVDLAYGQKLVSPNY
jgi:hypothetical protein